MPWVGANGGRLGGASARQDGSTYLVAAGRDVGGGQPLACLEGGVGDAPALDVDVVLLPGLLALAL